MTKPTIYSLAEQLQISPSTVSRAFSRPDKVRPEVRERIMKAAEAVNYQPHAAARRLATGRSGIVGILVPDITNPFFPPLVRDVRRAAATHGLEAVMVDSGETLASESKLLGQVRSQVDAFIVISPRSNDEHLEAAVGGVPIVSVNRIMPGKSATYVDDDDALFAAVGHLASSGHKRVALARGPAQSWIAQKRANAVAEAAAALHVDLIDLGEFPATFEGGSQAAPAVVRGSATAAIAFDDVSACGMIAGLAAMGLRVPGDISVVGCDDVPFASMLTPQLTTLTAPVHALGATAVDLMWREMQGGSSGARLPLRSALTVRGTTAPRR